MSDDRVTAQGEDLLAYLEAAITKAAGDANRWHDIECDVHAIGLTDLADLLMAAEVPGAVCDCTGPASVLRRCAADRKLIAEHGPFSATDLSCKGCGLDSHEEMVTGYYEDCPVLCGIAEGYGRAEEER